MPRLVLCLILVPVASLAAAESYTWDPMIRVTRPAVPTVQNNAWVRNPIDAFLAAEHQAHGLTPRPEAPKSVLLRRVYLDLIGLPPTREELHAFLDDTASDAYDRVVDRLLEDPRHGERWGRHWMDVWRYSDWAGYGKQVRDSQPHIWRWRDWIVESLNRDLPYDQMIVQMLAADELLPTDRDALRATGFLARNFKLLSREQWMQDTVDHTALAFLGLTVKCARCHDHMTDSITQTEYYNLRAIFEPYHVRMDRVPGELDIAKDGLPRVYDKDLAVPTYLYKRGDERTPDKEHPLTPGVPALVGGKLSIEEIKLPVEAHSPEKAEFVIELLLEASQQSIADAQKKLDASRKKNAEVRLAELGVSLAEAKHAALSATIEVERLEDRGAKSADPAAWEAKAIEAATRQRQAAQWEAQWNVATAEQALEKAVALRKESGKKAADQPEEAKLKQAAEKAANEATAAEKKLTEARSALEKAETAAAQPVTTAYEPRKQQTYPTTSTGRRLAFARWIANPENPLTARVAVNHIWLRHFGQALAPSVFDFGATGKPPSHPALIDWLAAELMDPKVPSSSAGGHSQPLPWSMKHLHRLIVTSAAYRLHSTSDAPSAAIDRENRYLWRFSPRRLEAEAVRDSLLYVSGQLDLSRGGPEIDHLHGLSSRRRSLYFRTAAEKQMTLLKLFDAPAVNECYQRKESVVPHQALALANSELSLVQARLLARELTEQTSSNAAEFINAAFERVLTRAPIVEEAAACRSFLDQQAAMLQQKAEKTAGSSKVDNGSQPAGDIPTRARENLVHVLLNHHEFVTIR